MRRNELVRHVYNDRDTNEAEFTCDMMMPLALAYVDRQRHASTCEACGTATMCSQTALSTPGATASTATSTL
jgi:hypothetical protein